MKREKWIWFGHPAHYICAEYCQFFLATYVGNYIVSTVGEMKSSLFKSGWEDIGFGRKYETMVFKAKKSNHKCCPFEIVNGIEIDFRGYNDAESATKGHYALCKKWSSLKKTH